MILTLYLPNSGRKIIRRKHAYVCRTLWGAGWDREVTLVWDAPSHWSTAGGRWWLWMGLRGGGLGQWCHHGRGDPQGQGHRVCHHGNRGGWGWDRWDGGLLQWGRQGCHWLGRAGSGHHRGGHCCHGNGNRRRNFGMKSFLKKKNKTENVN